MAELKASLEKAGFAPVKTHLNSGNVVFEAGKLSDDKAAEAVSKAVKDSAGVDCHVQVRSAAELKAALTATPSRRPTARNCRSISSTAPRRRAASRRWRPGSPAPSG